MIFSNEKRFEDLIATPKDISSLLRDEMTLISGDFYGIQKFIFDGLSTMNASKVLRAKSAFVQLFTEYIAKYICYNLGIDEASILSAQAGRFEILAPGGAYSLTDIQKNIDRYFIQHFFGQSGIKLSSVVCHRTDFDKPDAYRKLRQAIIDGVEHAKFHKFDLDAADSSDVLEIQDFSTLTNQTLCRICNRRKIASGSEHCNMCSGFVNLGQELSSSQVDKIMSSEDEKIGIKLDNFETRLRLSPSIRSYTYRDEETGGPANFEKLAELSCAGADAGVEAIAVLKADVDNMGKFLSQEDKQVTKSFEDFDRFSKTIDNFFSLYIPQLMREGYPYTYTVFAGGDDLFLVGAWDEILGLSRKIEEEFRVFVGQSSGLSISFGIAITKPKTPVSYLATHAEELLEESKGIDRERTKEGQAVPNPKDAITLFGETVKWSDYKTLFAELYDKLDVFYLEHGSNTAFLYRLLEFTQMSKRVKYDHDALSTMWNSKFRYSFNRNIIEKINPKELRRLKEAEEMADLLAERIKTHPKETKMVINEIIYKRRKR